MKVMVGTYVARARVSFICIYQGLRAQKRSTPVLQLLFNFSVNKDKRFFSTHRGC